MSSLTTEDLWLQDHFIPAILSDQRLKAEYESELSDIAVKYITKFHNFTIDKNKYPLLVKSIVLVLMDYPLMYTIRDTIIRTLLSVYDKYKNIHNLDIELNYVNFNSRTFDFAPTRAYYCDEHIHYHAQLKYDLEVSLSLVLSQNTIREIFNNNDQVLNIIQLLMSMYQESKTSFDSDLIKMLEELHVDKKDAPLRFKLPTIIQPISVYVNCRNE